MNINSENPKEDLPIKEDITINEDVAYSLIIDALRKQDTLHYRYKQRRYKPFN